MSGELYRFIEDKENVFEAVKAQAKIMIDRGELTQEALHFLLEKSFSLGKSIGWCQVNPEPSGAMAIAAAEMLFKLVQSAESVNIRLSAIKEILNLAG